MQPGKIAILTVNTPRSPPASSKPGQALSMSMGWMQGTLRYLRAHARGEQSSIIQTATRGTSIYLKSLSPRPPIKTFEGRLRPGPNFVNVSMAYENWVPAFAGTTG